jgi:phosphohistidine swiveling domain-containing protein
MEMITQFNGFVESEYMILIPTGEDFGADVWFEKESWEKYCRKVLIKLKSDGWMPQFIEKYEKGKNEFLEASNFVFENGKKLEVEELFPEYKKYINTLRSSWSEIFIQPWAIDNFFVPEIEKILLGQVGKEKFEEFWEIANLPTDYIATQRAQLRVLSDFIDGRLEENIDEIVREYCWMAVYNFCDKPLGSDYFFDIVTDLSVAQAKEKRSEIIEYVENSKKKFEKMLSEIEDRKLRELLQIINFYVVFRTERIEIVKEGLFKMKSFFDRLVEYAKREISENWEFNDVLYLTSKEIFDHFEKESNFPELEIVRKRLSSDYIHVYESDRFFLLEDAVEIGIILDQVSSNLDIEEFSGVVASKGKAVGVAKIVSHMKYVSKVGDGEILIAPMTFPEYLPAMKKAAAFVTNEGGITCHAAIISREMKKPCIIGTKIATQVLKDGDLVEVDADKGVVKILKKAGKK